MAQQQNQSAQAVSADMPPAMAEIKSQSAEEVLAEMNRMPLFMTTMDETDGEGGENMMLEALKALAYEGTRYEIAENFRQQGNECARAKQWTNAKEFYDKAIAALKGPQSKPDPEADAESGKIIEVEVDEEEEAKKEKVVEEACYVNRALCNLEKSKLLTFGISLRAPVVCHEVLEKGRSEEAVDVCKRCQQCARLDDRQSTYCITWPPRSSHPALVLPDLAPMFPLAMTATHCPQFLHL